jgi:four helix bundle protein
MESFENLDVFREAIALMVAVYRITESFPRQEMYGLSSQMRRSAGSVVAHIAEAAGRITHGEKRQLLSQGRGSLFETKAHSIAAHELGLLSDEQVTLIRERIDATSRPLAGFIRYVRRREMQTKPRPRSRRIPSTPNPSPPPP